MDLAEYKKTLPDDASCKAESFNIWQECPEDCPYNTKEKCTLMGV